MSKVQVLIATMNQEDYSLLSKMNIQTDALVGNQTKKYSVEHFKWNDCDISFFNTAERGVGLNRNNTLMRATGDYCLFADDDMVYYDNYEQLIVEEFNKHPDADILIFNVDEPFKKRYVINTEFKVGWFNFMRFGTVRIAAKREALHINGIHYNLSFGGGARFQDGDDTLFLADCVRKGLNIIAVPISIARLTEERESTWFNGIDDKYFMDKGVLFWAISHKWYKFLCLQDSIRHKRKYKMSWKKTYKLMVMGVKSIKK